MSRPLRSKKMLRTGTLPYKLKKWNCGTEPGGTSDNAFLLCIGVSDDVASRLQVSYLYKSDLQVSS